jgi:alanine racemase
LKRVSGPSKSRAWAEIDRGALVRNLRAIRARSRGRRVIAVVKADAYGHGAVLVARTLSADGCDAFAVISVDEALELREAGIREPILVLGGLLDPRGGHALAARRRREPRRDARLAGAAARRTAGRSTEARHRNGTPRPGREDLPRFRAPARGEELPRGRDDPPARRTISRRTTERQRADFAGCTRACAPASRPNGSTSTTRGHRARSDPDTNAVRPGFWLWGAEPMLSGGHALEPVRSLFARVCHAKVVGPGTRIGYGGDFVARETSRILTLAIGYADGLPRAVGGKIDVGWRGQRVPLVGRVSCDLATAAVPGDERVEAGDAVLIFGKSGALAIPVEETARAAGTISYEILARIGPRVPRIAT